MQATKPTPAVRSRCEPSRRLFDSKNPMPWSRAPTVLQSEPTPAPAPTIPAFVRPS